MPATAVPPWSEELLAQLDITDVVGPGYQPEPGASLRVMRASAQRRRRWTVGDGNTWHWILWGFGASVVNERDQVTLDTRLPRKHPPRRALLQGGGMIAARRLPGSRPTPLVPGKAKPAP